MERCGMSEHLKPNEGVVDNHSDVMPLNAPARQGRRYQRAPRRFPVRTAATAVVLSLAFGAGKGAVDYIADSGLLDAFTPDDKISEFAVPNMPDLGAVEDIPVVGPLIASRFETYTNPFDLVTAGENAINSDTTYGYVERETVFSGRQDIFNIIGEGRPWERHNLRESVVTAVDLTTTYTVNGDSVSLGYYPEHEQYYIQIDGAQNMGSGATWRDEKNIDRSWGTRAGQAIGNLTPVSEIGQDFQDRITHYLDTTPNPRMEEIAMCQGAIAIGAVWSAANEIQTQVESTNGQEEVSTTLTDGATDFDGQLLYRLADPVNTGVYHLYEPDECRSLIESETTNSQRMTAMLDDDERADIQGVFNLAPETRGAVMNDVLGFEADEHLDTDGREIRGFNLSQVAPSRVDYLISNYDMDRSISD